MAHAHLSDATGRPITSAVVATSGAYEIVSGVTGAFYLTFTATDHQPVSRRILLFGQPRVFADAVLPTVLSSQEIDSVLVTGDFNGFEEMMPMQRRADGTYAMSVIATAKLLRYQVQVYPTHSRPEEQLNMRTVNGSRSDRFEYDSGGDYRSVLNVKPGPVTIVFEPSRMPVSVQREGVCTIRSAPDSAFTKFMHETDGIVAHAESYLKQATSKDYPGCRDSIIRLARSILATNVLQETSLMHDLTVMRSLALTKLVRLQTDSDKVAFCRAYESIPATSVVWSERTDLIDKGIAFCADLGKRHMTNISQTNRAYDVRPWALFALIESAVYAKDTVLHREAYSVLLREYPNHNRSRYAQRRFPPAARIVAGQPIPDVGFVDIWNKHATIQLRSFRGSYLLIDAWATWCQPCVEEIPNLRSAWEQFKGRGLKILSISLDRTPRDAITFLAKNALPWHHAFSGGVGGSSVADALEVTSIPKPILVSPDGIIVEVGDSLREDRLSATLATYLSK